jgi:hypothetical protein
LLSFLLSSPPVAKIKDNLPMESGTLSLTVAGQASKKAVDFVNPSQVALVKLALMKLPDSCTRTVEGIRAENHWNIHQYDFWFRIPVSIGSPYFWYWLANRFPGTKSLI